MEIDWLKSSKMVSKIFQNMILSPLEIGDKLLIRLDRELYFMMFQYSMHAQRTDDFCTFKTRVIASGSKHYLACSSSHLEVSELVLKPPEKGS